VNQSAPKARTAYVAGGGVEHEIECSSLHNATIEQYSIASLALVQLHICSHVLFPSSAKVQCFFDSVRAKNNSLGNVARPSH
jgi:hypothetical protein